MKRKRKWKWILAGITIVILALLSMPEILHTNAGSSESIGSVRDGKLRNGYLIPYKGKNYRYFSPVSYYLLNNAYVHSSVYHTVMNAYKTCETTCPGKKFVLMECSRKSGGRMLIHWTHQNGTSVDFMVPKKNHGRRTLLSNYAGMVHYLFAFDTAGKFTLNPNTEIDFETMAYHILALDDAAQRHGLRIRKILFHTSLQNQLYQSPAGQELQKRNIRIIPHLNDMVNRFHDEHYHVDFDFVDTQ
jgi:penicillin-insensitive murein endopeptidase